MISGKTLMKWGYEPGPWFKGAAAATEATQLLRAPWKMKKRGKLGQQRR
jgi:hypothetical protein